MSSEVAISVKGVSKRHLIFPRPEDRLKQMVVPRLQLLLNRPPTSYYREFAALDDVSFEVRRGETVGIIGQNGSGKSTLLQIVCGTLQATEGNVAVNGRIAALLELGAGFNPEFTGRENVYLNAAIMGLTRQETDARFDAIAAFADIGVFLDQPVKTYSSGMYVRLAFSTAVNVDPSILIVDEALSVGDIRFQAKCMRRMREIKDAGASILFVSHAAGAVEALCDRAIWLEQGKVRRDGLPKDVVRRYTSFMNFGIEDDASDGPATVREDAPLRVPSPEDDWPWLDTAGATNTRSNGTSSIPQFRYRTEGASNPTSLPARPVPFQIQLRFSTTTAIERPLVGIGIFNELDEPIIHFNSEQVGASLPVARDTSMFNVTVTLPALRPGSYLLAVGVDNGTQFARELCCHVHDAAILRIEQSTTQQAGYIQMQDASIEGTE